MAACRAVVKVEEKYKDLAEAGVKKAYPGSEMVRLERAGNAACATFRTRTRETCSAVDARLHGMGGISVLSVSRIGAGLPPRPRTRSFWAVAATLAGRAGRVAVGVLLPDSPIQGPNRARMPAIQATFSLAVVIVVRVHDREALAHLAERSDRAHVLGSEINERIKGLAGSGSGRR